MTNIIKKDNSTPEGAILLLESAYNSKNIDAVFKLLDFHCEAEIMIKKILPQFSNDTNIISETAAALKLSLEKNLLEHGWPEFDNSNISFEKEIISDGLFLVTKIFALATECTTIDRLYVKKQLDNTYMVAGLLTE